MGGASPSRVAALAQRMTPHRPPAHRGHALQAWHRPPLLWRGKRCPHALRGVPGGGTAASATPTSRERPSTPTHTRHPAAQAAPHPPSPRPPKPQRHTASSRPPSSPHSTPLPPLRRSLHALFATRPTRSRWRHSSAPMCSPHSCLLVQRPPLSLRVQKQSAADCPRRSRVGLWTATPFIPRGLGSRVEPILVGLGTTGEELGRRPPPPYIQVLSACPPMQPPRRRCPHAPTPPNSATIL